MNSITVMILLQIGLIALNAVFACAEIAIISMNDSKLDVMAAGGDKRAIRLVKLTSQPAKFLATIQVAITLSGFLGSAFAAENFSDSIVKGLVSLGVKIPIETLDTIAVVVITLVLSYFTLVFGELVPKRVAMRKAEPLALAMSGLISVIAKIFAPIVWFLTKSTNGILRVIGINPDEEDNNVSEEEIRMMVDAGSEKGAIDQEEKLFIQNVFEFDDLTAGEIATHRTQVECLWLEESAKEWKEVIHSTRHSLYPVCEDSPDKIVGILNARDYFRLESSDRETIMKYAVKPAYFVPEGVKADVLFKNMKHTRSKMAVVLDEYGGFSGVVTINDLVEQLVGDLSDDEAFDEETCIENIEDDTWRITGRANIEDVAKNLSVILNDEENETFSGYVFSKLGNVPEDGSQVVVETESLIINVTEIREHQVEEAIVKVKK